LKLRNDKGRRSRKARRVPAFFTFLGTYRVKRKGCGATLFQVTAMLFYNLKREKRFSRKWPERLRIFFEKWISITRFYASTQKWM